MERRFVITAEKRNPMCYFLTGLAFCWHNHFWSFMSRSRAGHVGTRVTAVPGLHGRGQLHVLAGLSSSRPSPIFSY